MNTHFIAKINSMGRTSFILLWMVLFGLQSTATSQQVTVYTVSDGLSHDNILSILEDNSGNIWFGTESGLTKWDTVSNTLEEYSSENSPLKNKKINAIVQDNEGQYWFGTDDGLYKFDIFSWKDYKYENMSSIIREREISCLFIDSRQNLWIGTAGGGVTKLSVDGSGNENWTPYDAGNSGIAGNDITAINEDRTGAIWIGTRSSGICKLDRIQNWTSYSDNLVNYKINAIYRDKYDTLWIGTYNNDGTSNGVVKTVDGSQWIPCESVPATKSIAESADGALWFGTEEDGLYKWDGSSCRKQELYAPEWSSVPQINSMLWDHTGFLWLGTDGSGLGRVLFNWQVYGKDDFGVENDVIITGIDGDSKGNLWISTAAQGIAKYDGRSFRTFPVNFGPGSNYIRSIMVDNDDFVWISTNNGAHCFDSKSNIWILSYDTSVLTHKTVKTIIQDRQGRYWFGTVGGIARFDGASWKIFDENTGLSDDQINVIFEDENNQFWIGTTTGGVCTMENDSVVAVYNESNGLSNNSVVAIVKDDRNRYWFGTSHGVSILDDTTWSYLNKDNGELTSDFVKSLYKDGSAEIWVGTQMGGLVKFSENTSVDYSKNLLGAGNIYAIFEDINKTIWLGTSIGLIQYIPDRQPPETEIISHPKTVIDVSPVVFSFNASDDKTPADKLCYSWSLTKIPAAVFQNNWSDYSTNAYAQLYPHETGIYRFLVKAKDESGNEDLSPASFTFTADKVPPTTVINFPASDAILTGTVTITGTAFDSMSIIKDFEKYWLDYAFGENIELIRDSEWHIIADTVFNEVINDTLMIWDVDTFSEHGSCFIRLSATDTLNHLSKFSVKVTLAENLQNVRRERGASMYGTHSQIHLYIPPGALDDDVNVYYSPVDIYQDSTMQKKYLAYKIDPASIHLKKPANLSFYYNDANILNMDESKLSVKHLETSELLGGYIEPANNEIRTTIRQFGTYVLVEDTESGEGDQAIYDIACQPRIFSPRGGGFAPKTTISFRMDGQSKMTVKVYNLAGRLVRVLCSDKLMAPGYNPMDWDGRDYNGEICPSDLYIVSLETDKTMKTKTVMILDKSNP